MFVNGKVSAVGEGKLSYPGRTGGAEGGRLRRTTHALGAIGDEGREAIARHEEKETKIRGATATTGGEGGPSNQHTGIRHSGLFGTRKQS